MENLNHQHAILTRALQRLSHAPLLNKQFMDEIEERLMQIEWIVMKRPIEPLPLILKKVEVANHAKGSHP